MHEDVIYLGAPFTDFSSSCVNSFTYDYDSQVLRVRFKTGREYVYIDIPPATVEGFCQASSKGRYLYERIKLGVRYQYSEL